MPAQIYAAPTAAGKTAWVIEQVRDAAKSLRRTPYVVVATPLQAAAMRRRLAAAGGVLGVRIVTFDGLHAALLQHAHAAYTELEEPVRYRLLRTVLDELVAAGSLTFYHNLVARPGFISAMEALIGELKGAGITPAQLGRAFANIDAGPRLAELGKIYTRYDALLAANNWTDRPGVALLALNALQQRTVYLPAGAGPVYFDGFDSFTVVQRRVIAALAEQVDTVAVLLTSTADPAVASTYVLFAETAELLGQELSVEVASLPPLVLPAGGNALRPLADRLFVPPGTAAGPSAAPVTLLAAADRAGEVRAALRWLKQRIVLDGVPPQDLLLLARDVDAYRDLVSQTAAEFGMAVYSPGHLPLAGNPAVAALLALLSLLLPDERSGQPLLPRRGVVEAWRSPYFDWHTTGGPALDREHTEALDALAREYIVMRGLDQWRAAFSLAQAKAAAGVSQGSEDRAASAALDPAALAAQFEHFVACLAPPAGAARLRDFACWLEDLIGPDPAFQDAPAVSGEGGGATFTLDVVACIRRGDAALQARDIAALRSLKDVLRGLVAAETAVQGAQGRTGMDGSVDYGRFLSELLGAVAAASYEPVTDQAHAILFTDPHSARGVSYQAVAMLGLAEGELPRRRSEDPFLRNADRRGMRSLGLPLEDSTRSFDRESFHTSVARARTQLLLCRPRMAENGAPWEPSPYWQAVESLLDIPATTVPGEYRASLSEAASLPELVESALRRPEVAAWQFVHYPQLGPQLDHAAALVAVRSAPRHRRTASPCDGYLGDSPQLRGGIAARLEHWSPSRLERYRTCPYWFYLTHVLQLEQRAEPDEGANFAQAGNIYHRIFEQVYRSAADPANLEAVLAVLPAVAKSVLDAAPEQEGFRVTAWWAQTRAEIEANVRSSLVALAAYDGTPTAFELRFGRQAPLQIGEGETAFTVSGVIDRVDRRADGTLRIVDYKTGVSDYDNPKALVEGHRLQLALYALAAEQALQLGQVSDGFYWFAHKARSSSWSLMEFEDPATGAIGPAAAVVLAVSHAVAAVDGARRGEFAPQPPDLGCPDYCAAAAFCWHFRPKFTG
ncbi:MAG: PD-(D/E)XK nuclease family protein [Caldilineaceae bacterium]